MASPVIFWPVPADFVEDAKTMGVTMLGNKHRVRKNRVHKWAEMAGITLIKRRKPVARKPAPDDFHIYGPVESYRELEIRYGCGSALINHWRKELGIEGLVPATIFRKKETPADFMDVVPTMTREQLMRHYQIGNCTLRRMLQETGAVPKMATPFSMPRTARSAAHRDFKSSFEPTIDDSLAGRAQRHLQSIGAVFKASTVHKDREGYIVFGRHMTTEAMMDLARAKGWMADDWKVAA